MRGTTRPRRRVTDVRPTWSAAWAGVAPWPADRCTNHGGTGEVALGPDGAPRVEGRLPLEDCVRLPSTCVHAPRWCGVLWARAIKKYTWHDTWSCGPQTSQDQGAREPRKNYPIILVKRNDAGYALSLSLSLSRADGQIRQLPRASSDTDARRRVCESGVGDELPRPPATDRGRPCSTTTRTPGPRPAARSSNFTLSRPL